MAGSQPARPAALIATFFGVGRLPRAPGTWAALAALPLGWGLVTTGGVPALVGAICGLAALGLWASDRYARGIGVADPARVVVDEVVGQWIALICAPLHPLPYLLAFVLFRVFDIAKPWPVSWIDRRVAGGIGIMADDAAAGFYALIVLQVMLAIWRAATG
jgi:phosphatidylglycerophosphatase A